jgi:predicted Zn-dependent protease with MMP-like domain
MTTREFKKLVQRAIDRIPARFQAKIENLAFVVEREGSSRDLLGLYVGRPLTERSVMQAVASPDVIQIYQAPHERMAHDDEHLAALVEETVWHEVAHYFGLDEPEVLRAERRREIAKRRAARPRR